MQDHPSDEPPRGGRFALDDPPPLTRVEAGTLHFVVAAAVVLGVIVFVASGGSRPEASLFQLALMALFALFAWHPPSAVLLFSVAVGVSFLVDSASGTLFALAASTGLTMRTGRIRLIVVQLVVMLVATLGVIVSHEGSFADASGYLFIAAVSSALGLALRGVTNRSRDLSTELARRKVRDHEAIMEERRRIAGELHDNIAHDLTVIAMHSRLLGAEVDDDIRERSGTVIVNAARQALVELRRVIDLDGTGPHGRESEDADLVRAVESARLEMEPTGRSMTVEGDPAEVRIARSNASALSRILRESVTNILKHGGDGPVKVEFTADGVGVAMRIVSPIAETKQHDVASGGTGIVRMAERTRALGGTFTAAAEGGQWVVSVHLPAE